MMDISAAPRPAMVVSKAVAHPNHLGAGWARYVRVISWVSDGAPGTYYTSRAADARARVRRPLKAAP